MTAETGTAQRADARRKRAQIVAAAKEMFSRQGPHAPMEEIARAAVVGVGTLYRHFPDRQALIRAVAQENFAAVLAETRVAVAEEPTAWAAFVRIVRQSRELRLSVRLAIGSPLAGAVIREDPATGRFRRELLATLDTVVRAAQAEGTLRADVGTGDVVTLLSLLLPRWPAPRGDVRAPEEIAGLAGPAGERVLALMLDSLRTGPGDELPGRPLALEDAGLR